MNETSPAILAVARAFLLARWNERAAELGRPSTTSLAGACKFAALFAQSLWGGRVRANFYHTWLELADGAVVDLTECDGVTLFRPYERDLAFEREPEFAASLESCRPRVEAWLTQYDGLVR